MKKYNISRLKGNATIDFDSLPTAKITDYPYEAHDYKPYAQGAIGFNNEHLAIRLTSFEYLTTKNTFMICVLYFGTAAMEITVSMESAEVLLAEKDERKTISAKLSRISGEDLQGQYWGWKIYIDLADCQVVAETLQNQPQIKGNIFKLNTTTPDEQEEYHIGGFALTRFSENTPFYRQEMASFDIVDY